VRVCVLALYNKAQAHRISNREFKLWTIIQGTESRVATFHAEKCVMSHQSLSRQATKSESPTAVVFGSKTSKSDQCVCVCVCVWCESWFDSKPNLEIYNIV